ncbi:HAD family phosphatase [Candidatus Woesearchaeota archaeon]|nr:HAD family phosphatase [Candidatus Woesearchaeota archaeon]
MKKVIIFDNEWVIVGNDWNRVAREISDSLGTPLLSGKELKQSFRLYDPSSNNILYQYNRGLLTPDNFWSRVLESYSVEPNQENITKIRYAMEQLTTDVDQNTVNLIARLKSEGHPLYMLSNSTPEIFKGNSERHDYFKLFDRCYFSFETGFRKPTPEAYFAVVADNKLKPENCIFIDDKDENLEGARRLGMIPLYHKIGDGDSLADKLEPLL